MTPFSELARIDRRVTALAYVILNPSFRLRLFLLAVRLRETRDIATIVAALTE